jgi:hypothetical protein
VSYNIISIWPSKYLQVNKIFSKECRNCIARGKIFKGTILWENIISGIWCSDTEGYQTRIFTSNVKTVKDKRSTNVPTSNRNEAKIPEVFIPKSTPSKEIMSIWSRRTDSGPNQNNLFSTRQIWERYQNFLVSFPKRYRIVCLFVIDITNCSLWN